MDETMRLLGEVIQVRREATARGAGEFIGRADGLDTAPLDMLWLQMAQKLVNDWQLFLARERVLKGGNSEGEE